jgi:GNAT superfamily N-acetyltransferase
MSGERRRGVGTALLRHVEAVCRQRECSKIMLLSSSERGDAHRFFEGLGYSPTRKVGFVKFRREFGAE